ncbi:LPXTG cell wall anchor domain-containing protein [Secundilactobacillus paracollinoides]|nr:LPXTG cell wall anchor domain-containing protein [Secundilactobacillus paracollinoides]
MQNDIAGATTHQQATQNETLPQTDEQASAYSMMGLLGILMSFLGLGVTRKKHDTK